MVASSPSGPPRWVEEYERLLPEFTSRLRKTIHVAPTHPMYRSYYDYAFWRFEQGRDIAGILESYISLRDATVLDLGAGCGGVSARLSEAGAQVMALDVAWGFLHLSQAAYRDLGLRPLSIFATGEKVPVADHSCDIILGLDILEHIPDPFAMLDELARCLKPGGLVCLQTGYRYDWKNIRRDPHYGLPLVVLLPRWLRELVVVRLTRRNPQLEDHYWFKSYREVCRELARRRITLHREAGLLIGSHLEKSHVVLGCPGDRIHLDGDESRNEGFFPPEEQSGLAMRWSRQTAYIRLLRKPDHRMATVRLRSLHPLAHKTPQSVELQIGRNRNRQRLRHHDWTECSVHLSRRPGRREPEVVTVKVSVHPTWRPSEHGHADTRCLGVAVHSAELK